jgi:hypothetical protein
MRESQSGLKTRERLRSNWEFLGFPDPSATYLRYAVGIQARELLKRAGEAVLPNLQRADLNVSP